ncbi:hypothetical protein [Streptomyces mirabilis]|uniref:Hypervirulence associated protein TUDOR domain-containing protein n=1 Tax=Streptomyces mirabilis TaxID=68239 RepID=A0ABU3V6A4_9ACTN|nr:hypothetical protein [Streptomyces mirabilis]MDU9001697.1 hypothetical protein [Streptomyces mirabilis]
MDQLFSQGTRVEYRNHQGDTCQGMVERVEGAGPQTRYTIKNEKNQQWEQVEHSHVDRRLQ